ncbi:DUF6174 domain-containing protein [Streptomyces sp. NPDC051133]|uniref:DUF6174 domain-containing protein n=1 Tax=Streptomyces sp. NPDC051133 TaxID=3155521 RepID=UPI003442C8DD
MLDGHSVARFLSAAAVAATLTCLTTACEAGTSPPSEIAGGRERGHAGAQHTTRWKEPASYTYTLTSTSDVLAGTFRVEVHGGKVTNAVGLDEDSRRQVRDARVPVPTIGELLKRLEKARSDGADTAEAQVAADGHPLRISLDGDKNAIDDEALYVISAYEPAPSAG